MTTFTVEAVLFDMDFTLFNPGSLFPEMVETITRNSRRSMQLDFPEPNPQDVLGQYGQLAEPFYSTFLPPEHKHRWREIMPHAEKAEVELLQGGLGRNMPGAHEVLEELHASGLKLAIASNCGEPYLRAVIENMGFAPFLQDAECIGSHGAKNKVEMVAHLLARLGTTNALMVGDRHHDMEAAHANGLSAVGIPAQGTTAGELDSAEVVIESLSQLPGLIAKAQQGTPNRRDPE